MQPFRAMKLDIQNRENLDLYATIVLSIGIALLNAFGVVNQSIVLSAILATLSIVAGSLLVNRHQNELLQQTLAKAEMAEEFLKEEQYNPSILRDKILRADRVFFSGLSLSRTIVVLENCLEEGIKQGLKIQILLIKPKSEASRMMGLRDKNLKTESAATNRINHTLTRLSNIARASGYSEGVMVRVLDYFPAWGILAIDPNMDTGYISVRLNAFRVPTETCPRFELHATKDAKWFSFFVDQLNLLWNEAEPIDLSHYGEIPT